MDLAKKVVLFVGGYSALGMASCKELLRKDIGRLVVLDIERVDNNVRQRQLVDCNKEARISFLPFDVTDKRELIQMNMKRLYNTVGNFDILINGVGGSFVNDRQPRKTIEINLLGLIETTMAAIPLMSAANSGNGGMIVNMSSVFGLEPGPFIAIYTASQHGIIGFTRACADPCYYNHTNISHVAFCPSFTCSGVGLQKFTNIDTFDFSPPLSEQYQDLEKQSNEDCARNLVECIEQAENGSVWISDMGELREIELEQYWEPALE